MASIRRPIHQVRPGVLQGRNPAARRAPLAPGTRISNFRLVNICSEGGFTNNFYEGEVAPPENFDIAFITTPAGISIDEDHEAVITGKGKNEGITNAV